MQAVYFEYDFGSGFAPGDPPVNWKEMKVQEIWTKDILQYQLQSISFQWVTGMADKINQYRVAGLTGSTGLFEMPGLRIYIGALHMLLFDGGINISDPSCEWRSDKVVCPIKESGRTDWFNDMAQSFEFWYLTSTDYSSSSTFNPFAQISRGDYKQIPYCLSTVPDYEQAILLALSEFIMIKESVDVVLKIESLITAAISESISWLILVGTIIQIILYLIYLIAIIIAGAKLLQELFDNIIQPKKTKLGMRELDLFLKGSYYLGLQFSSSIYAYGAPDAYGGKYVNATLIPKKIKIPEGDPAFEIFKRPEDETSNPDSYGYFEGTFKQYIDQMCLTYNAACIVRNNVLYFEEVHTWDITSPYMLRNQGEVGNTFLYPEPYSTNASEIPAVYKIKFQKDDQDTNTYNDYTGTWACATTTPLIVRNIKNQTLSGAVNVELPFAHARRKLGETKIEKELLKVISIFESWHAAITNSVNNINGRLASCLPSSTLQAGGFTNNEVGTSVGFLFGNPVYSIGSLLLGANGLPIVPPLTGPSFGNDRVGWMLLSNDFIGVQKRFIGTPNGDDWYIDPNNQDNATTTIVPGTSLNGTFTGTISGVFGATIVTGTVISGHLICDASAGGIGSAIGVCTGTIAGLTGTYTAIVTGVTTGGNFHGNGAINLTTVATVTTAGHGSALSLLQDFHSFNLIDKNQWLIFKNKKIRFGIQDWLQIGVNNVFKTADGRFGKFDKLVWEIHKDEASDIEYRIKKDYTLNYKIIYSTDNG